MIIIITGMSHVGKTVLAQRLLEKMHFPYLSIDHLKMGLIRSGNTLLTPEDDDELTGYLWPIVREMIKTAIENRQNLIVEGCYVPFDWREDFTEEYLADIRFVALAMTDAYIDANFDAIRDHRSDVEGRFYEFDLDAEWLKAEHHKVIDGCRAAGEAVTLIDGDYEQTIARVVKELAEGLQMND
ncbi:MAG: adenylate kinase [Lachnospiraceae bacterium]|nr:adenylate kinase [Lachnospiraceae bacterium]